MSCQELPFFDLGGLKEALGMSVDVLTLEDLPLNLRDKILAEAQVI